MEAESGSMMEYHQGMQQVWRPGMTRETLSAVADAVIILAGVIAILEAIHRLI
jgi:hypothetical protein